MDEAMSQARDRETADDVIGLDDMLIRLINRRALDQDAP